MQKLFTGFIPTTAAQWKEQLIKDLKGVDYNTLVWKTNSGIDVQPFYTKENLPGLAQPIFTTSDWAICEWISVTEEKTANTQALNALQNGASGLVFSIGKPLDYAALVKGISLEHIYSLFVVSEKELENELSAFLGSVKAGPTCFLENDELLSGTSALNATGKTLCINTTMYQEAGATTVHELGCSIAHLNEYLNTASATDTLADIKTVHISVSVGGDFFMEIAKLRALRELAGFLLMQYSSSAEIHLHAQTTSINKSSIDRYNNMLRSTTEAMSASIGGANSILVLPFDVEFNAHNDFSSRMARNQQLILKDESYLNVVADISAGSYYIESLTQTLCEKAWETFKSIESKGGLSACISSNFIPELIAKDAEMLIQQFKEGKLVLVGVNKFQNKKESPETPRKRVNASGGLKAIHLSDYAEQQAVN
jgi:methylmalonyl-CoA mutase